MKVPKIRKTRIPASKGKWQKIIRKRTIISGIENAKGNEKLVNKNVIF